jgi:hypothetical protein
LRVGVVTELRDECEHDYEEIPWSHEIEGETYWCFRCNKWYRLYSEDMP